MQKTYTKILLFLNFNLYPLLPQSTMTYEPVCRANDRIHEYSEIIFHSNDCVPDSRISCSIQGTCTDTRVNPSGTPKAHVKIHDIMPRIFPCSASGPPEKKNIWIWNETNSKYQLQMLVYLNLQSPFHSVRKIHKLCYNHALDISMADLDADDTRY